MGKNQFWLILLVFATVGVPNSQAQKQWLSKRVTNTSIFLDPTEVQMFGSITSFLNENLIENQYIPFGIGGSQSIFSKTLEEDKAWEIIGELGAFTQFEWVVVDNMQERNLLNTDYRIAFSYARKLNKKVSYRFRVFHVSSHLGDDFIFDNRIRNPTSNNVNYEQLEFTYYRYIKNNIRVYGGVGSVVRPNSPRRPFSYHLGSHRNIQNEGKKWGWTMGWVLKGFQETDFNLNLKAAIGPAYFTPNKDEPLRVVLEYYRGHLPYSQFESSRIEWLGLGLYFYL